MISPINLQYVLADPDIQPYYRDEFHDLTAADVPTRGPNEFVIFKEKVPKTQVLVVKGFMPYGMERVDINTGNESAVYLDPPAVQQFVTFEPYINDKSIHIIQGNAAQFQTLATPPTDRQNRESTRGYQGMSDRPYVDVIRQWYSSLFTIVVRGNSELKVIFRLIPVGAGFKTIQIGTGDLRIDYAGIVVAGMRMPEQMYNDYIREARRGGIRNA